jgi:predicted O-methyltransferase YrrM
MNLIINYLAKSKLLAWPRKIAREFAISALSAKNGVIVYYNSPEQARAMNLIKKIKKENDMLLFDNEAYQVYMAAKATNKIPGYIAEVGVYKGGSARIIAEVKGKRVLHLFDTFEGLPEISKIDNPQQFYKGKFLVSFEDIKKSFTKYSGVHFYKGLFPDTAGPVKDARFSFVNLDVDLYESTKNCLEFFYPRMSRGGIIISHDYIDAAGVKKAVDEFYKDKPETVLELSGSQCLIVKL